MTGAELTARLYFLGLSQHAFAAIHAPMDVRALRRMASGVTPVTDRVEAALERSEREAHARLDEWLSLAGPDWAIQIPRSKPDDWVGGRPASWWHALSGRLLEEVPDARIEYPV